MSAPADRVDDRHYGTDSSDEFDTLVELTVLPDGSHYAEVVIVDKRDDPTSTH